MTNREYKYLGKSKDAKMCNTSKKLYSNQKMTEKYRIYVLLRLTKT
jgi:hypothetical protein